MTNDELNKNFFTKLIYMSFKNKSMIPNYAKYNGAIFAGINGCAIKAHGNSDKESYKNAIEFGIEIINKKQAIIKQIHQDLLNKIKR